MELKKGIPVWVGDTPREYVFTSSYGQHYTNRLLETDSVITPLDSHIGDTLTVEQYIEHVMVPDGWEYRVINISKHLIKTVDDLTVVIFVNEEYCKPKIGTALGELTYFTDNNKGLGEQALAHCEKLNILKQLEN